MENIHTCPFKLFSFGTVLAKSIFGTIILIPPTPPYNSLYFPKHLGRVNKFTSLLVFNHPCFIYIIKLSPVHFFKNIYSDRQFFSHTPYTKKQALLRESFNSTLIYTTVYILPVFVYILKILEP